MGIAHAVPTRQVVAGFRDTSTDNRRILLQEWLAEAITMWTLGLTGARTPVIWFKICPVLLGGSAALLLLASFS